MVMPNYEKMWWRDPRCDLWVIDWTTMDGDNHRYCPETGQVW